MVTVKVQVTPNMGQVLFDAILRQSQFPSATVMIALPDFPVFTNLIARTRHALKKLSIGVLLVRQTCTIEGLL